MLYQKAFGGSFILQYVEDRIFAEATYIVEHGATVRDTARALAIGKSTVHKDVTERLRGMNPNLFRRVRAVLNVNKAERHLRGGRATHEKYAALRQRSGDATADR